MIQQTSPVPILELENFQVSFAHAGGSTEVVRGIDLRINRGESFGLVGESGSGKTQTILCALGLGAPSAKLSGVARLQGKNLVGQSPAQTDLLRANKVGFIFQNPMTALTPHLTIGRQLTEVVRVRKQLARKEAIQEVISMLDRVGIADARRRMASYPHQFSGGMRQRAMIAMALLCDPILLVADEPTTALDVTVQAQILDLLEDLRQTGLAILFVSHNIGAVARLCERIGVMYAGKLVEIGPRNSIFAAPRHPYTQALLKSLPRLSDTVPPTPIPGEPPQPGQFPLGCAFSLRCDKSSSECTIAPRLRQLGGDAAVACHLETAHE